MGFSSSEGEYRGNKNIWTLFKIKKKNKPKPNFKIEECKHHPEVTETSKR